jgi:hypothetical protein
MAHIDEGLGDRFTEKFKTQGKNKRVRHADSVQ